MTLRVTPLPLGSGVLLGGAWFRSRHLSQCQQWWALALGGGLSIGGKGRKLLTGHIQFPPFAIKVVGICRRVWSLEGGGVISRHW